MSLLVVGLSHRTAPVSVLERATLSRPRQGELLHDALATEPTAEAAVLATCNRIELYADVDKFHAGVAELSTLLARHSGVGLDELTPHLYVHYEDRAVHHLFSVACGLDSMVVGEGQILAQIKDALAVSQDLHTAGRLLNDLFQQSLRVGKRAHSETGIDRAGQSLVTFGLQQFAGTDPVAGDAAASLTAWAKGKRALVIGAGSMSSLAAATLARAGVAEVVVANRTLDRAERLVAILGEPGGTGVSARAVPMDKVAAELTRADVVVSCTGASGLVLTAQDVADAIAGRAVEDAVSGAPVTSPVLLDLAMPRDVDAAVHDLEGVRLVDIESLAEASADAPMAADVDQVRTIVSSEVETFGAAQRAAHITPTVVALRTMAADVVAGEIARLEGRLPDLADKERAEITQTVKRVVDKLLHAPTVRIKELAAEPGGAGYADALRTLFDLDPEAVASVSRAERPRWNDTDPRGESGIEVPGAAHLVRLAEAPGRTGAPQGIAGVPLDVTGVPPNVTNGRNRGRA
ncbi:glutamyl-tRNA reductase [Streptomyces sp. NPDC059578]|uniref:glutamyl-tRNA reductase n=1 Tax=Streptomyces sp. NPDC059578 TaxID=3346874 RepID=UPI00368786ED